MSRVFFNSIHLIINELRNTLKKGCGQPMKISGMQCDMRRATDRRKTRVVSISLTLDVLRTLDRRCAQEGRSRSGCIAHLIVRDVRDAQTLLRREDGAVPHRNSRARRST